MDEEWAVLTRLLPENWRELARETGAMRRARGSVTSPDVLLQVVLLHVATGLSLKQAVVRAGVQGLVAMSDVALLKRLRHSEHWLRTLSQRVFESTRFARAVTAGPGGRRVRAVDTTTVNEPGATGTDWRVHYAISLPDLQCDVYELTDVHGGETYTRIPVALGDIILGDRGYCHRAAVAHVVQRGGDVVVRLTSTSFPLLDAERDVRVALLPMLRGLEASVPGEWPVRFTAADRVWAARLCAVRKSQAAADRAKKKIHQQACTHGTQVNPDTLECAEYIFVLTMLDRALLGTCDVLGLVACQGEAPPREPAAPRARVRLREVRDRHAPSPARHPRRHSDARPASDAVGRLEPDLRPGHRSGGDGVQRRERGALQGPAAIGTTGEVPVALRSGEPAAPHPWQRDWR